MQGWGRHRNKKCPKKEFFHKTEGEIPAHLILNSQRICQIQAYPITNVWLVFTYFIGKFVQVPTIQLKKQSPEKALLIFVPSAQRLSLQRLLGLWQSSQGNCRLSQTPVAHMREKPRHFKDVISNTKQKLKGTETFLSLTETAEDSDVLFLR